jgi:cytochrome c biogenesis protein CcmG, thiol:disulfide interchange protein DsbE
VTAPTRRLTVTSAAVALVLAACTADADLAGPPVPDRPFETFAGDETSLAAYTGEPLVVNFFASWCPPCVAELPDLQRVHEDLGDDVRFVGLNTQDSRAAAAELVERTGVTFDLGIDPDGALFRDFEVVGMPSTFLVDADGAVVHRHTGLVTERQLRDLVADHLAP